MATASIRIKKKINKKEVHKDDKIINKIQFITLKNYTDG